MREVGRYDFGDDITLPTDAGVEYQSWLINTISQGTAESDRLGKQVSLKNWRATFMMQTESTATSPCTVRVVVVYDTQANGAVVADATLWESPTKQYLSQPAAEYTQRYQILYDRKLTFGGADTGSTGTSQRIWDINVPLKGRRTCWSGITGNISDLATGSLFLLMYSESTSATNQVRGAFTSRLYYYDQ
jgi:hypothetical protein